MREEATSAHCGGYGAMVTEMVVGIMALIAACAMEPGQYFSINMKGEVSRGRCEGQCFRGFQCNV